MRSDQGMSDCEQGLPVLEGAIGTPDKSVQWPHYPKITGTGAMSPGGTHKLCTSSVQIQ